MSLNRILTAWVAVGLIVACLPAVASANEVAPASEQEGMRWLVSPMAGWDRNTLKQAGPGGQVVETTDTAPEYGLTALMIHPNWVINDFFFYSDVNDCNVWGNLFFANYYANAKAAVTWNAGLGYLYHKIEAEGATIYVKDPMAKAGPFFRVHSLHLTINPYLGYAWERVEVEVETPVGTVEIDSDNDSYLYGLTIGYHWRMLEAGVNYYYQDSQDIDEDFQVCRARVNCFFTKTWGIAARIDYAEHQTTDDKSVLIGPVWVF